MPIIENAVPDPHRDHFPASLACYDPFLDATYKIYNHVEENLPEHCKATVARPVGKKELFENEEAQAALRD